MDESQQKPRFTADRAALAGLLLFTLVVRGGALWAMRNNLQQDPDAYREIAENLLKHGEFALGKGEPEGSGSGIHPTAYRPPLYPVVLSNMPAADGQQISLTKVAGLHILLGVGTVWLTWLTARLICRVGQASAARDDPPSLPSDARGSALRLTHPTAVWNLPLIAGLIVACDPILLNQQSLVMTETLAGFLAILSLWCLARFDAARSWLNAALAGGTIGLAVLCRPTFLPWLGLVGIAMLVIRGRKSEPRVQTSGSRGWTWTGDFGWRAANLAGLTIVAAGVVAPWAIRNYHVFGKPILTTTHGGYTLLLGNNHSFYRWLVRDDAGIPWKVGDEPGLPLYLRQADAMNDMTRRTAQPAEFGFDQMCYDHAIRDISASPQFFALACAYRIFQLWSPLPNQLKADESVGRRMLRYATSGWYFAVYLLAASSMWRLRWKLLQPPWIWGVLLCLAFTAVHTFYWTNLRMRAPLMPFVAIVAAAGAATITSSVWRPRPA